MHRRRPSLSASRYCQASSQAGFTFLGVLFATALIGIGLAAVSEVWITRSDREKIAQVNWIGQQYVNAIRSYYYSNTGSVHYYPSSIGNLLEDRRHLSIRRHLRSRFDAPINSMKPEVSVIIGPEGGINGLKISIHLSESIFVREFIFHVSDPPSSNSPL